MVYLLTERIDTDKEPRRDDTLSCCGVPVVAGDALSISGGYDHRGIERKGLSGDSVQSVFLRNQQIV